MGDFATVDYAEHAADAPRLALLPSAAPHPDENW